MPDIQSWSFKNIEKFDLQMLLYVPVCKVICIQEHVNPYMIIYASGKYVILATEPHSRNWDACL